MKKLILLVLGIVFFVSCNESDDLTTTSFKVYKKMELIQGNEWKATIDIRSEDSNFDIILNSVEGEGNVYLNNVLLEEQEAITIGKLFDLKVLNNGELKTIQVYIVNKETNEYFLLPISLYEHNNIP